MGSSLATQSVVLAILCAVLFFLFDAARSLAMQLGPMWLRVWSGERTESNQGFHYTAHNFTLVTGTLLQFALVGGVAFTALAMAERGMVTAALGSALIWTVVVAVWKLLLALVPEWMGEYVLRAIIPVSQVFYYIFWPILFPLRILTERRGRDEEEQDEEPSEETVQAYIDVGEEEGILEEGEGKLIQSIVDFGDRVAHEVMTPRIDMLAFDVDGSRDDLARVFAESKYSRIPLYEGNVDKIFGIVHIKDLFDAYLHDQKKTLRELASPAYMVPESKSVSELLREFQVEHLQIAIVLDEYGGTAGLVTLEDMVEEIVGEIADEHEDEEEMVVDLPGGGFLVNGHFRVERLEELTKADLHSDEYETVAGLIFTRMGRIPKIGQSVSRNGWRFEVDRVDRKRIYRVRVVPEPAATAEDGE